MSQEDLAMTLDIDQHDLIVDGSDTVVEPIEGKDNNTKPEEVVMVEKSDPKPRVKKIYSSLVMPAELWEDVVGSIELITMPNLSYKETMDKLMEEIEDPTPKEMTIFCFHELIYTMSNEQLIDGCDYLRKMVEIQGIHKISYCCAPFPPEQQAFWYRIGLYNAECRILNISRHIPPLNLHKAVMKNQNEDGTGPCIVKGYMWQEYCDRTGLGSTLSYQGFIKIKKQLVLAVTHQFIPMNRKPSRHWPVTMNPPPLCTNEDYLHKPIMVKFLKDKDQFNIRNHSANTAPSFRETGERSKSASSIQNGANATPAERELDRQETTRPATWYGQDFSVNFQPLGPRRKVIVPVIDDAAFEEAVMEQDPVEPVREPERQRNYIQWNTVGLTTNSSNSKTKEELMREIRKLKADKTHTLSEQKKREDYLKERINKLHDMLSKEENDSKKYEKEAIRAKKEAQQLELDVEAMKLEKELRDQKVAKLEVDVANKSATCKMVQDQVKLLTDQYKFIKQLHDEKSNYMEMLTQELGKKKESSKKDKKKK